MQPHSNTATRAYTPSYLTLSNLIDDCCIGALNCTAVNLLRLILNRTVRIGRRENSITYDEMQYGVFVEGVCMQRGLGISTATIAKHVKTLTTNQLVTVRFDRSLRNGFMYSIYSINETGLRKFAMAALPIPRKQRGAQDAPSTDLQTVSKLKTPRKSAKPSTSINEVTGGRLYTTFGSDINDKGELKFSGRSAHCKKVSRTRVVAADTAEATLKAVGEFRAGRKATKPAAGMFFNDKGELKQQAFSTYWTGTVREHYPGAVVVGFTVKEFCVFRNMVKHVFVTVPVADVVQYLVAEWKHLLREFHVSSAKWKASDVPDVQSVIKHWSTIRPLLVAYFSAEAVTARQNAGLKERVELKEARATKDEVVRLTRKLEAEQGRIKALEHEKAEVYVLARRKGVDISGARAEREASKTRTQTLLDAQSDALDDESLPDWK